MKEDIVRLTDPEHLTVVSIATSFGNNAYSMTVRGVEILYKPAPDLDAWRAKPGLGGVPLLSPWANRIEAESEHTRKVFAVTNNHYLGKGVVNALQLISMLKGAKVNVPEPLRQHYPELEKIASTPPERPTLFPMGKETKG